MLDKIEQLVERLVNDILLEDLSKSQDVNVYKGSAGKALLFALLSKYKEDPIYRDHLYKLVSHCINNLNLLKGKSSLSGYSGILLVLIVLVKDNQIKKAEIYNVMSTLKDLVIKSINYDSQNFNLDFLHGLIGKLITLFELSSLLESNERSEVQEIISKNIRFILDNSKQTDNKGEIFWETTSFPVGIVNTGLAHGLASVINFLTKAYYYEFIDNKLKQEIRQSVFSACNFLINRRTYNHQFSFLNKLSHLGVNVNTAKYCLAWCNGDLGISYVLNEVGRCFKSQKISSTTDLIIKSISMIQKKNSGIHQNEFRLDNTFCHGSFGVFFLFYLLNLNTDIPKTKKAYLYWLDESLGHITWDKYFLDLRYCQVDKSGYKEWNQSGGLLFGATGQCLCLLSFLLIEKNLASLQDLNWLKFIL